MLKQKFQKEIKVIKEVIIEETEKYRQLIETEDQDGIKNAFVVFRSMEGAARMI